jgi:uncharacterized membrane protein
MQSSDKLDRVALAAGGLLLLGNGIRRGSLLKMVIGGYLAYRGIAGTKSFDELYQWTSEKIGQGKSLNIRTSMVVNKPREEVYRAWRNLSNLPLFMDHLINVREEDRMHSQWEMKLPGGVGTVKWRAEIVKEKEGEMIAWNSIDEAEIHNAGKISFRDALGGEGTRVDIVISYKAPLGAPGEKIARVLNPMFKRMVEKDIHNFKNFVELGEYRTAGTETVTP